MYIDIQAKPLRNAATKYELKTPTNILASLNNIFYVQMKYVCISEIVRF